MNEPRRCEPEILRSFTIRKRRVRRCVRMMLCCGALANIACQPGSVREPWDNPFRDPAALLRSVAVTDPHLSVVTPFFAPLVPGSDRARLFVCRWPRAKPLRVVVAGRASESERSLLRHALLAWQRVGLGLQLDLVSDAADIEVRFVDDASESEASVDASADCVVGDPQRVGSGALVPARLVAASVIVRHESMSHMPNGKLRPRDDSETLGMLVHGLGHALGVPSHASQQGEVMSAGAEAWRAIGEALAEGKALRAPAHFALYLTPSGSPVGEANFSNDEAPRLSRCAALHGWLGPHTSLGPNNAQLTWQTPEGRDIVLQAQSPEGPWPKTIQTTPNEAAQKALQTEACAANE